MDSKTKAHITLVKIAIMIAERYYKTIASIYDKRRYAEMKRYINIEVEKIKAVCSGEVDTKEAGFDNGVLGRVIELYCHDSASTMTTVRKQGQNDGYIPTVNGKRIAAEIKTNGGQVQEMLKWSRRKQENTIMVYFNYTKVPQSTSAKKANKPVEYYDYCKILTVADFFDNAVLKKPDKSGKVHIQPTSQKMFLNLENFPDFERNVKYDF